MFGILEGAMWLSLNIYHEARGEDRMAQLAVAHATINRAHERRLTVKDTILQPHQFSWTFLKKNYNPTEATPAIEAIKVAADALSGKDFTGGATHYHREDIHPEWADHMTFVGQYGSHLFYKERMQIKATMYKKTVRHNYASTIPTPKHIGNTNKTHYNVPIGSYNVVLTQVERRERRKG